MDTRTVKEIYEAGDEGAMLRVVRERIADGTIKWQGACVADNYGTDGDIRYQQSATIDGVGVIVYWDTTLGYDEWDKRYKRIEQLESEQVNRDLTGDEQTELDELAADDPREDAEYTNDESNNCDWDNPVDVRII